MKKFVNHPQTNYTVNEMLSLLLFQNEMQSQSFMK